MRMVIPCYCHPERSVELALSVGRRFVISQFQIA
jgi:hypothetical protein